MRNEKLLLKFVGSFVFLIVFLSILFNLNIFLTQQEINVVFPLLLIVGVVVFFVVL